MRSCLVVVLPPRLDRRLGVAQADEVSLVEALVTKFTVEALDESVLYRLARLDEGERDTVAMSSEIEGLPLELRTVVADDRLGESAFLREPVQRSRHPLSGKRVIHFDRRARG